MTRNVLRTTKMTLCLIVSVLLVVTSVALACPSNAWAEPTAAEKQAEADEALEALNEMQEKLDIASADYFTALDEQEEAEANRDAAQERIESLNEELSDSQDRLAERARSMYRTGTISMLDMLLGSETFQAFTSNWDLITQINQSDSELIEQTKDLRSQVETEEKVYEQQAQLAEDKAAEAKEIEEEAQATVDAMQETYDNLSAEAAELLEQEQAAEEAARQAEAEAEAAAAAAAAEAEEAAAAAQSNSGGSSSSGSSSSSSDEYYEESSYDASTGNVIVDRAYGELGKPYVWGAAGPDSYDCSGLVSYCITGKHTHAWTTYSIITWPQVSNPQPGDICVSYSHCGVYIGDGQMIHAPHTGDVVKIGPVQSGMIYVRY